MIRFASVAGVMAAACAAAFAQSAPPQPRPGQCFARVTIPEVAEIYTEERIVSPARTEERPVPARFETIDTQVLVSEPRTEHVVVPGVYRAVTETVVVSPERVEPVVVPATWTAYTERVMVRPAYATWRTGCAVWGRPAGTDQLCRVEVPAQFAQVQRRRVTTPESVASRIIPAVTRQVVKQELVTPARIEVRQIPAQYRTVKDRRLVAPATTETVTIPEVRQTERLRRIVSPARTEWREVLCGANASPARLTEVQRALNARGYATAADGVFGPQTQRAMEAFQRANNLAVGTLTVETAQALGVTVN